MTKIKICGITREEDARASAELGADYLGFVFVKESPRWVEAERVSEIVRHVTSTIGLRPLFVGVFRDALVAEVHRIAAIAHLDIVQLHGEEDEEYVRAIDLPVIKAFRIEDERPTSAQFVMYDSGGGTGRTFDWSLLQNATRPFFLAGGLTPDNVADAIRQTRPDAVDVSSGVESAPGIKDHQKLRDFFEKVRQP